MPAPAEPPGAAAPGVEAGRGAGRFGVRLLLAHILAYPAGFLVTVATMPLVIGLRGPALAAGGGDGGAFGRWLARDLGLAEEEARVAAEVLGPSLLIALVVALWIHLWAVPWARSKPVQEGGDPAGRRFALGVMGPLLACLLLGAGGWLWLFLR